MGLTQAFIEQHLKREQAKDWVMETVSITASLELEENEVVIIERVQGTVFNYYSADEQHDQTQGERITLNKSFIEITAGTPILIGVKITITEYFDPLEITLITDKNNIIKDIKVE